MGYKNRTVTLNFEELGDGVYVTMKNPKLQSPSALMPRDIPTDEQGRPRDPKQAEEVTYEVIAGLVVGWMVFDANDESEDPPCLPLPATAETVGKLPMEIILRLSEEMAGSIPGVAAGAAVPSL